MKRKIVYAGQVPYESDILYSNLFSYISQGKFQQAILGTSTQIHGFDANPTPVPSLAVVIGEGEVYDNQVTDGTAYGVIPSDSDLILKQGIIITDTTLSTPAPVTVGDSIDYLVQIGFQEVDDDTENRPYFNILDPNSPIYASNVGTRDDLAIVAIKPGTPAPTGTQTTPPPDVGYVGAWVVTVANGQTSVLAGDITAYPGAPFVTPKISQVQADARYVPLPTVAFPTYFFRANKTINQTLIAGDNVVLYDNVVWDPKGWFDPLTGILQPDIPCYMRLSARAGVSGTAPFTYTFTIRKNGGTLAEDVSIQPEGAIATDATGTLTDIFFFDGITDYAEIIILGTAGNVLDVTSFALRNSFSGEVIANG